MKYFRLAVLAFVVLVILVAILATKKEPDDKPAKSVVPLRTQIVAKHDLQALTLLNDSHLEVRPGNTAQNAPTVNDFLGRCLLVTVKQGAEVKDDMVTPTATKNLVSNAVAVSIPTTATTFVGGQLRAGDVVDLVAVSNESKKATPFEDLMVLNIAQANKDTNLPSAITLALPSDKRNDFAPAIIGAELVITRKIR